MKITKSQLKQLIKEETEKFLSELKLISEEEYSWIPKSEDLLYPWQNDEQDSKLDSKLPFPINPDARSNLSDDYTRSGLSYRAASNLYNMQQNNPQKFTDMMADLSKDGAMLGGDKPTPLNYPDPRKFEPGHIIIDPDTGEEIENPYAVDFGDPNDEFKEEIGQRLSDPNGLNDEFKEEIKQRLSDQKDKFGLEISYFNPEWKRGYEEAGGETAKTWTLQPLAYSEFRRKYGEPWLTKGTKSLEDALTMLDKSKYGMPDTHQTTISIGDYELTRQDLIDLMGRERYMVYLKRRGSRRMRRGFRGSF